MARSSAASSVEISELQRRMAQIRREMHEDVQGAVRGAQSLTDWRSIVGSHPWAALGVAIGVGYLLVPHRKAEPQSTPGFACSTAHAVRRELRRPRKAVGVPTDRCGASACLPRFLIRAAQNYALNYLEQWLEAHPLPIERRVIAGSGTKRVEENAGDREAPTRAVSGSPLSESCRASASRRHSIVRSSASSEGEPSHDVLFTTQRIVIQATELHGTMSDTAGKHCSERIATATG